ncbi:MAG: prephenate dehydrogenase [Fimbriimonas sp.]
MTVGIAGLGLIGGSIGLALRKPGNRILGYDPSPAACATAIERQCVDHSVTLQELAEAEAIFIASTPSSVISVLEGLMPACGPDIVVSDCASVKGEIVAWTKARKETRFVPGHPMAGHEKSGAAFSSAWLFRHARWILTPLPFTDRPKLHKIEALVKEMGSQPMRMNAATHDRQVAILSHLPHAFAAVLVSMGEELESAEIAGGSWRDLTRVGGVDPELWTQIFMGNRAELLRVLGDAEGRLAQLRGLVEAEDAEGVKAFMLQAAGAKAKHEPKPTRTPTGAKRTISRRRG